MRSVVVVAFHEGVQCKVTLVLAGQRVEVYAFELDGLEPALDLPVRMGPVRPGPAGTHAKSAHAVFRTPATYWLPLSVSTRCTGIPSRRKCASIRRRNPEAVTPHSSGSSSTYATRVAPSMAAWITVHPAPRERDRRSPVTRCPGPPMMRPSFFVSTWSGGDLCARSPGGRWRGAVAARRQSGRDPIPARSGCR